MYCIEKIYFNYLIEEKDKIILSSNIDENFYNNLINKLFCVPTSYTIPYYWILDYDYVYLNSVFGNIFNVEYYLNYNTISCIASCDIVDHVYKIVDFERTILKYNNNNNKNNCLWCRNGLKYDYFNNNYMNYKAFVFTNCSIIYDKIYTNKILNNAIYNIIDFTIDSIKGYEYPYIKECKKEKLLLCGFLDYNFINNILDNGNIKFHKLIYNWMNSLIVDLEFMQYYLLLNFIIEW
ncbi:hypothetical protein BCR36DRAFT_415010 [Piromyces finnis]|uniref:Uncharacterized protein n=1 Tax=Piromyces finnis TaxID=1754191 RepID=A0A1Y1V0A3_9FUNG|nr:hypothetical protein BCR36DRAFT_415010 [Piromyces finnis]|eukprot:ORX44518.1 hypothetical protein BCR36DRAFT_415010 [Piromyces finnis]